MLRSSNSCSGNFTLFPCWICYWLVCCWNHRSEILVMNMDGNKCMRMSFDQPHIHWCLHHWLVSAVKFPSSRCAPLALPLSESCIQSKTSFISPLTYQLTVITISGVETLSFEFRSSSIYRFIYVCGIWEFSVKSIPIVLSSWKLWNVVYWNDMFVANVLFHSVSDVGLCWARLFLFMLHRHPSMATSEAVCTVGWEVFKIFCDILDELVGVVLNLFFVEI